MYHALALQHIVIPSTQANHLRKHDLSLQTNQLGYHLHLYLMHHQLSGMLLVFLDGCDADVRRYFSQGEFLRLVQVVSSSFFPIDCERTLLWFFVSPDCEEKSMIFIDYCKDFDVIEVILCESSRVDLQVGNETLQNRLWTDALCELNYNISGDVILCLCLLVIAPYFLVENQFLERVDLRGLFNVKGQSKGVIVYFILFQIGYLYLQAVTDSDMRFFQQSMVHRHWQVARQIEFNRIDIHFICLQLLESLLRSFLKLKQNLATLKKVLSLLFVLALFFQIFTPLDVN